MSAEPAANEAQSLQTQPFGFWATCGLGAFVIACVVAVINLTLEVLGRMKLLTGHNVEIILGSMAAFTAIIAIIWVTGFRGGWRRYCAFVMPGCKQTLFWMATTLLLGVVMSYVCELCGYDSVPEWSKELLRGAHGWTLAGLLGVAVVAAPVWEEFLFRGFLYAGWSCSFVRPLGAVLLGASIWAALHKDQYEWFYLGLVFGYGCFLGYVRYRTGSLILCIFLHMLNNLAAFIQTMWVLKML